MYESLHDCSVHYFGAQQLAFSGELIPRFAMYESIFPQLYAYTSLLSFFVRIFRDATVAYILSNILFDGISVFFLVQLLKKLKKNPSTGVLFWTLNPCFIIMCWCPMAVVVVNTILIISIYLGYCLLYCEKDRKIGMLIMAALFGVSLFVGNLFRPMFYVLLIAMGIMLMLKIIKKSNEWRMSLAALILAIVFAILPGKLYSHSLTEIGGYEIPENRIGWNFYVGASFESEGKWNSSDHKYFWDELMSSYSISESEEILFREGIERYTEMTPATLISHIMHKLDVLYADVGHSIHNLRQMITFDDNSYRHLAAVTSIGYVFLLCCLAVRYVHQFDKKKLHVDLFATLSFVGFTMAYMLVEVMNRYVTMPLALMIVVLCLTFSKENLSSNS